MSYVCIELANIVLGVIHYQLIQQSRLLTIGQSMVEIIQALQKSRTLGSSLHSHPAPNAPDHHVPLFPLDLLNRHILDDILCAKRVVSTQNGMRAW